MKKIDKLCEHMRKLQKDYHVQNASQYNDIDMKIALKARIELLQELLQEAAFIKRDKNKELDFDLNDVGC